MLSRTWLTLAAGLTWAITRNVNLTKKVQSDRKAFENIGGFRRLGIEPNTKAAVLFFGFFHGLGLATKLQDLALSKDGLVTNMVSFNVGVEIGQLLALGLMLIAFNLWRRSGGFFRHAFAGNVALMAAGFVLAGFQLTGFFTA